MKRPITLLCLADLHLVEKQSPIIKTLRKSIKELMLKEPIWSPDFLVIAGDMVDALDRHYDLVKEHIDSFVDDKDFHLDKFRFIAAPGNHDKDFPFTEIKDEKIKKKLMRQEKKKYKTFVSSFDSDSFDKYKIKDNFKDNFKSFGSFYSEYVTNTGSNPDVEYIYPKRLLGNNPEDVALTSGMKVFHDAKVCFLSVNTEWVYLPKDSETDSKLRKICPQLVLSSLKDEYSRHYRDYALVTIMHRSPYELTWTEKNSEASNVPDVLRYIYNNSDVILSGHDHIEKVLPPHMMENKAQLFQLGSASVANRKDGNRLVRYLATLIHMDVVEGTLRMCNLQYDHNKDQWTPNVDSEVYPLYRKMGMDTETSFTLSSVNKDASVLRVNLKSTESEDIEKTILGGHPDIEEAGYGIIIHNINDEGLKSKIKTAFNSNEKVALFVYTKTSFDHVKLYKLKEALLEEECFREWLYQKKLIIKEISLNLYNKHRFDCWDNPNQF